MRKMRQMRQIRQIILTAQQRAHLKEMQVRCSKKVFLANIGAMREKFPDKCLSQICRVCAEIAHTLRIR